MSATRANKETTSIYQRPVKVLQNLIRFDTTNPPGNESACISYIDDLLTQAGFETKILARDEKRANLVTRLPGRGQAPPLLLYGHVDVVPARAEEWTHPPFAADIADGYIWGRGTLDMKGAVAMMLAALMRAKAEGFVPPGDVVFAALSDEERGGDFGARFLVEEHAEWFDGIRYALGEAGGFSLHLGESKVYPIMVAEKQMCWMKATVRGQGGHGSAPVHGQAMARLAKLLTALDRHRLPVHITPVAREMISQMANTLPLAQRTVLRQLLNPLLTDRLLGFLGPLQGMIAPLLHNTVSATVLHGGSSVNVIPSEVSVELDGRLLPGYTPDDMVAELRAIVGDEVELAVKRFEPGPPEPDMGLYPTLAEILVAADPEGTPIPLLVGGVTDGRHFARLGIQTYGFTPMKMPPGFNFFRLAHGADERIPEDALDFGIEAIYAVLHRFGEGN
ncbi:MAG: M20/M25/M40 family metallo-hydrolase [Anaerolineae bacterium]|jgi:acetylornithine deacetylase/succinyl-diaminopimelate desuccinylase-like protein